jgi:hypothetical protein
MLARAVKIDVRPVPHIDDSISSRAFAYIPNPPVFDPVVPVIVAALRQLALLIDRMIQHLPNESGVIGGL